MCTAVTFLGKNSYFGRNLDFEHGFGEQVVITPRNYPFSFCSGSDMPKHFAIIGMAAVDNEYPLYYDGTNEWGLSMAGLYFPGNAVYLPASENADNIAPFEFIPWVLGQCANVQEAIKKLHNLNLVNIPYSDKYALSPLHWLIADRVQAVTVEPTEKGLQIFDNPFCVLTNNPPFEYHMHNICNYLNLTREQPDNRFSPGNDLTPYSRGMGGIGLPGDLSSASRFVRAAFIKSNSVPGDQESESISQFFHILSSVEQQNGCVRVGKNFEKTIYSSCCNTDAGIYYYKTYENSQITAINMRNANIDGTSLVKFPLHLTQNIKYEN